MPNILLAHLSSYFIVFLINLENFFFNQKKHTLSFVGFLIAQEVPRNRTLVLIRTMECLSVSFPIWWRFWLQYHLRANCFRHYILSLSLSINQSINQSINTNLKFNQYLIITFWFVNYFSKWGSDRHQPDQPLSLTSDTFITYLLYDTVYVLRYAW